MQGKLTVTLLDETTQTADVLPADFMRLERQFDISSADLAPDATTGEAKASLRIEYMLFLAYTALRRAGKAGDDFEAWADMVTDIDADFGGSPDPLDPAAITT